MIFKHVSRAAQICSAHCNANILPNLTNQNSSFHILVRHGRSVNTMLDYYAEQLLAREESGLEVVKEKNPKFLYLYLLENLGKLLKGKMPD